MAVLAFLGPLGTFTHEAATRFAAPDDELVPVATVDTAYDAVAEHRTEAAVVAIDNTVEGPVIPSVNRLLGGDFFADDRRDVRIAFCALRRPGDTAPATAVVSHAHALAQCAGWARRQGLTPRPAPSTAAACARLGPGEVALAPRLCAEVYGLDVVAEDVQDYDGALTTFLHVRPASTLTGAEVAAFPQPSHTLLAVTPHLSEIGCFTRLVTSLSDREINIFSLLSRPVKAAAGAYTFVFDLNGTPADSPLRDAIQSWLDDGHFVKILGVYPWSATDELTVSPIDHRNTLPGSFSAAGIPAAYRGVFVGEPA